MTQPTENKPLPETTKDDSSDVAQVQQKTPTPPPENPKQPQPATREDEEAQKGHS